MESTPVESPNVKTMESTPVETQMANRRVVLEHRRMESTPVETQNVKTMESTPVETQNVKAKQLRGQL